MCFRIMGLAWALKDLIYGERTGLPLCCAPYRHSSRQTSGVVICSQGIPAHPGHDYSTLPSILLFLALASFLMFDQNVFFVFAALEATWYPVEEGLVF